jgi:hypothetical protein
MVDFLARARYRPRSKREQFVLLRFVARANLPEWGADRRITLLKRHVGEFERSGLEPYLHMTLAALLESPLLVHGDNYLKTCLALDGYANVAIRATTADLMTSAGRRIYGDDEVAWIHTVLRYCKKQSALGSASPRGTGKSHERRKNGRQAGRGAPSTGPVEVDVTGTFAASLTTAVARNVVARSGSEGCRMLASAGWWTAGESHRVHPLLSNHMRATLTTEIGSTIHPRDTPVDQIAEYKQLVQDLLNGRLLHPSREAGPIAFYLLKHSVPTYGRSDVVIRDELRPLLGAIQRDPAITRRVGDDARALLAANGFTHGQPRDRRPVRES